MKNKEKYNLRELEYVIRYTPYWNLYTIEVRKQGIVLDTIKTKKPKLEAVMEWLESECSEQK